MKDTLYIAVTGVHGSGKTALCGKLADAIQEIGLDVAVGAEVARNCPYPIGLETTHEAQNWIYDAHYEMEIMMRGRDQHDVVIFDRTLLDNVLYEMRYIGFCGAHLDMASDAMDEAQEWLHNLAYDLIIRTHYVPELCVCDDVRSSDPVFAQEIEVLFDVFMSPFVDVDVVDVRNTDVIQTTVKWVEDTI